MDATSIASMINPQEDDYMLSAKMPAQFPREIPQMLSVLESNNFPSMGYNDRDHFARYITPLDDEIGMQLEGGDGSLDWSTISNHILSQPPAHPVSDVDEEIEGLLFQDIATRPQANSDTRRIHSSSSTPTNNVQDSNALYLSALELVDKSPRHLVQLATHAAWSVPSHGSPARSSKSRVGRKQELHPTSEKIVIRSMLQT
ncbi:hypothetical protein N7534_011906 [Penicillium rubens]|nr:hypothetical protein N7534_011906 [Penicillium rubens]